MRYVKHGGRVKLLMAMHLRAIIFHLVNNIYQLSGAEELMRNTRMYLSRSKHRRLSQALNRWEALRCLQSLQTFQKHLRSY